MTRRYYRPVTSERDADQRADTKTEPPWHEQTSTLAIASVAALIALGILYFLISTLARQFNEPDQAPQYYVDPGGSSSFSHTSSTTTTSETITSTVPPVTTELNPGDTPTSTTTSSTDTTSTNTNLPSTHRSTSSSETGESSSTHSRPRFNETRTLYPRPG
jgi:hypothetical protein